jgi:hypothetical protein
MTCPLEMGNVTSVSRSIKKRGQVHGDMVSRKVKILEHAETMGDWPTRFERPRQDVTLQFWTV